MAHTYDVVIVGAGTAGLAALHEIRKQTDNFLIVNDGPFGTTCARVGCMPSKALVEAANAYHRRTSFDAFGIDGAEALSVNVPRVLARVRQLRDDFVRGALKATESAGERSIAGRARFEDAGTLVVGGRRIHARKIILATGSRPNMPEAWRVLGDRVLTSDTIFEQDSLPGRMAVIGLGPIGVELGQALARFGIDVVALGRDGAVGGISDPVIHKIAVEALEAEFTIHFGPAATLEPADKGVRVRSGDMVIDVDKVLAAIGRRPNLDDIGLDRLGIELDGRGMPPFDDRTLQLADLPVFIAGDVNARMPVLHEAADDGYIAGRNAVASAPECYARRTRLAIVFIDPNVAVVGRPFADLAEGEAVIGEVSFARHGRARTAQENHGALRVYADKQTGKLLGAELCAPAGEHLAHLLALGIQQNLRVTDMLRTPIYHPVMEEGLRAALRRAAKQLPTGTQSDLAHCEDFGIEALD